MIDGEKFVKWDEVSTLFIYMFTISASLYEYFTSTFNAPINRIIMSLLRGKSQYS